MIVYESKTGEEIKIIDFGIAKSISMEEHGEDLTLTGEIIGTPAYMSPEQCLGENIDPRSDLYSLGCVAYEMVSGRKPFSNQSALKVLSSHVNEEIEPIKVNDDINGDTENLTKLIFKALRKTFKPFRIKIPIWKTGISRVLIFKLISRKS